MIAVLWHGIADDFYKEIVAALVGLRCFLTYAMLTTHPQFYMLTSLSSLASTSSSFPSAYAASPLA